MSNYPNEPTIHESINQFFDYYANHSLRLAGPRPSDDDLKAFETVKTFIEEAYEIAFGEDAINKDWHPDAVIEELKSFSDKALKYDEREY
tara:strand:+ start:110 stop:379 length:270 start_codon:yes stop_codon:yes gene_type:complete